MHTTVRDEKYNHSICSTICAQECTECINSCLARRSAGASTARRTVCCDNLLPAWTQAANEASPVFNPDVPFHHSAGERDQWKTTQDQRFLFTPSAAPDTPTDAAAAAAAPGSASGACQKQSESAAKPVSENLGRLQQLLAAHFSST